MIGALQGIIEEASTDHILLDVRGVGYIIYLSTKSIYHCKLGEAQKLFITVHHQKDKPDQLYGFISKDEQKCLNMLIKVSGISCKTAILILSKLTPNQVFSAIAHQDKLSLKVAGVGTKLIERLITELKSEVEKAHFASTYSPNDEIDAIPALVKLGYDKSKVYNIVHTIKINYPDLDTNGIIKQALKEL